MRPPTATAVPLAASDADAVHGVLSDFKELLKPGITAFVMVMAAAGYVLALDGPVDWVVLLGLMAGTGLTGGGACALNHVIERRQDALMARTAARPVPAGRLGAPLAAAYGVVLVALGAVGLALTTNALTTGLALATVFLYVAVYTPLKQQTVHNTLVGAIPGALPALGGATAASGALDPTGWSLFAVLYLWQLPHFFALAWMFREDYERGGFRMLPNARDGAARMGRLVLGSTLLLLVAGVLPALVGHAGPLFLIGMVLIGAAFTVPAVAFYRAPGDALARRLLLASIAYVPAFFVLVVLDFLLRYAG
jgi:protoheme IX farnesyltransferase